MTKSAGKSLVFAIIALVATAAGYGYFSQTAKLDDAPKADTETAATNNAEAKDKAEKTPFDASVLTPRADDIVLGDASAPVTMVEYSSLSCPHCAHFHEAVLPELTKQFLDTKKAKLIVRPFPLNESALRGAQIIECAGQNKLSRENYVKVLFSMQSQWAFSDKFVNDLRRIALVGGLDSAAFDSCIADKALETRIVASREEAATKLHVNSTPTFFINGVRFEGAPTIEELSKALDNAQTPQAK